MNNDIQNRYYFYGFYVFMSFGTLYLFIMNYWHDFLEVKTLTLEQRIFLMNYNNFHYEHGIWLSLYAFSGICLILYMQPEIFKENWHLKERIKEKVKEGKKKFKDFRHSKQYHTAL